MMMFYSTRIFAALILTIFLDANVGAENQEFSKCGYSPIPIVKGNTWSGEEVEKESHLIIGGQTARRGSWPWMVSISARRSHFCGGSIITNEWILTAAHCVYGYNETVIQKLWANFGTHVRSEVGLYEIRIRLKKATLHPGFVFGVLKNDIALLMLQKPLKFNLNIPILPVCLPEEGDALKLKAMTYTTGWGKTTVSDMKDKSDILKQIMSPVTKCDRRQLQSTNHTFCVLFKDGEACKGDSGSPAVALKDNLWVQYGIVSHSSGECGDMYLSYYTQVSAYIPWIRKEIQNTLP